MRALSVRSALHLNSQPISRVVTLGVAGVQVPNGLFSIHYSPYSIIQVRLCKLLSVKLQRQTPCSIKLVQVTNARSKI